MPRRKTINKTEIRRLPDVPYHNTWVVFTCLKCSTLNYLKIGKKLLNPVQAHAKAAWKCNQCGFVHSKESNLPEKGVDGKDLLFKAWGKQVTTNTSLSTQRFWKAFFTTATENKSSYWKQCNTCGRILPSAAFSGHKGWGPLEKQMECILSFLRFAGLKFDFGVLSVVS